MKNEELREFIYYTQFQKKLPIYYFFLTKEFIVWAVIVYIMFLMLNSLIFSLVLLLSFAYMIREYFHYKVIEKYELPILKKIITILKGNQNDL